MSTAVETSQAHAAGEAEIATFYVGNQLMGVNIQQVQEINRHVKVTAVPHALDCVRGVINLRGEVVTVVDLRTILGLEQTEISDQSRNVIVKSRDEKIGLLVDRIADVESIRTEETEPPPANVSGVDGRFFKGIHKLESELLVILDVEEVLSTEGNEP
ncbi:MAG: chemotaxis protein CheW [Phycisphaerae bacterium]|nr:chemotaxis protein CheW [Phycisphaerae bacterium]